MVFRLFLALMFAVAPLTAAEPLRVLVFTTTDCPISNRYAPEIERLATKFKGKAQFVLVYPVPTDSPQMIREHAKKFAYSIETVRDTDQRLVKQTGVTVTPEVAVMSGDRMMYRGRIDDRYIEFGKDRPQPTQRDLEAALDAVTAGRRVPQRETRAIGCFLSDLVK
jgi:thiol-disulfide isomerase/thioredoxin